MRSTLKYDIIVSLNKGFYFMKTKIIYISGDEIFDITDIRAAFEEVRNALNLDKNTILFGVPIDKDDAELAHQQEKQNIVSKDTIIPTSKNVVVSDSSIESSIEHENITNISVFDEPEKKSSRSRKKNIIPDEITQDDETKDSVSNTDEEKIIPILSVLSDKKIAKDSEDKISTDKNEFDQDIEIIEDETNETVIESEDNIDDISTEKSNSEPDLEQLLSEMKPLQEDILDEQPLTDDKTDKEEENENIDATLEKLANEFIKNQDKIASGTKSAGRSKIGKLRNILPFKQSKHHDQGLGDLFGWAGVAANDEDFSVPGFFTSTSSKK